MGMDVIGNAPTTKVGAYFRNNVWYWRPLWGYCQYVAPKLTESVNGGTNDGDGLNAEDSIELGRRLLSEIVSGRTKEYETDYRKALADLPLEPCDLCNRTGIRGTSDPHGVDLSEKELSPEQQALYGRTHGWCNVCDGAGEKSNWVTQYPFEEENVKEFAEFLLTCGGFSIC